MNEWFAASELAGLPGMPSTVQGINRLAKRACWANRQRLGRGGGAEYNVKSLPTETRHALAKHHTSTAAVAGKVAAATVALQEKIEDKAAANARVQSLKNLTRLTASEHARTSAWLSLIGSFEIFQRACGYADLPAMYAFCAAYNNREIEVLDDVRAIVPTTSAATLRRKRIELRTQGVTRLAGNYGNRKGASKIASQTEIKEFVLAMLHEYPHASCEHVNKGLQARFGKRDDIRLPSERSIQRFIAAWKAENAQLYTAVTNPDKWRNRYLAAAGSASEHIVRLNQVWEADSTPADIMLADGKRHAIIGVIDVFNRDRAGDAYHRVVPREHAALQSSVRRQDDVAAERCGRAVRPAHGEDGKRCGQSARRFPLARQRRLQPARRYRDRGSDVAVCDLRDGSGTDRIHGGAGEGGPVVGECGRRRRCTRHVRGLVMTVYVDSMRAKFGRMVMCHMIADTEEELHALAARIGVARRWHQAPPAHDSHYDIALSKKALAIAAGAVQITWKQCGCMTMRRRVTGVLGSPEDAESWVRKQMISRGASQCPAM